MIKGKNAGAGTEDECTIFQKDSDLIDKLSCKIYNPYNILNTFFIKDGFNDHVLSHIYSDEISIIDLSTDPHRLDIKNALDNMGFNKKIIYLTSLFEEANGDTVIFFPSLMYHRSLSYSAQPFHTQFNRRYNVSCLNRIPREHKFYTYVSLLERSYANDILLSFNGVTDANSKTPISYDDTVYYNLPPKIKEKYKDVPRYKESLPDDNKWFNDLAFSHPAFKDTYLNICTETSSYVTFFSEKICKPLAAGQFFMMVGGCRNLNGIRSMGIDCYDDIFDGHSYELDTMYIKRIDKMMELLDEIYSNIPQLYHDNFSRIQDNQRYYLSQSFRDKMLAPLKGLGLLK